MWTRSIVNILLSFPAATAVMGIILAVTPANDERVLPLLLLFYPLWVAVASGAFLFRRASTSALFLVAISAVGFGSIELLKVMGVSGV